MNTQTIITIVGTVLFFAFLVSIETLIKAFSKRRLTKRLVQARKPTAPAKPKPYTKSRFDYGRYIEEDARADWDSGWTPPQLNPHIKDKYYLPYSQQGVKFAFNFHPTTQANVAARTYWESQDGNYDKWKAHKAVVHEINGSKCQYCEATTDLHCHEVWDFVYSVEHKAWVQKWTDSQTLCSFHHKLKHADQHISNEEVFIPLLEEYARLNQITLLRAMKLDFELALRERREKEERKYNLDLSFAPGESDYIEIWENEKFLDFVDALKENSKGGKK